MLAGSLSDLQRMMDRLTMVSVNYNMKINTKNTNVLRVSKGSESAMKIVFAVPRQFVYGHFVYDTSSTDISSTDILSTIVYQRTGQLYIQLLFQQIIIFINSNFYLHC